MPRTKKPGTAAPKLEKRDSFGRTALHDACVDARLAVVERLVRGGADVNAVDEQGWTPLHFAAQSESPAIIKRLVRAGAAIDAQDEHGNTPLFRAVFASEGDGKTIKALLALGANPRRANKHRVSPLKLASSIANYDLAKFFKLG